jgi:sulfate adenylyltransferase
MKIFGTLDDAHPGVKDFRSLGNYCVSGPIQVLNLSYFESEFSDTFRTAVQVRDVSDPEPDAPGARRAVSYR